MSDSDKSRARKGALYWFTPLGALRRAQRSIVEASASVKDSFSRREEGPKTPEPSSDEEARRRFEEMYRAKGWTEAELKEQFKAVRSAKITALALMAASMVCAIGALIFAPLWIRFLAFPLGVAITVLCFAQALRFAIWEAQIEQRAFISARTFVGYPDFWSRLIR